jgi:hypothetical protein
MRFMGTIASRENQGEPPAALFEAMGPFIQEALQAGVISDTGGLEPSSQGTRFEMRGGKLNVVDGPYAEAREVIGGWVIYNVSSREEAMQWSQRFVDLHQKYWPAFEFTCEVRQIMEPQ